MMLSPSALILVAYMPFPRDLEIARVLGWYRIPFITAPKIVAVDYLAFYQPASFGDRHQWMIEYLAPVRGHELVTRSELLHDAPDHPRAAEEYFKIQLGPLEKLTDPIRAEQWKRITFFYTTGKYLLAAKTIHDLVVHSEERKYLWRSLRERAKSNCVYGIPEVEISPEILAVVLGIKDAIEVNEEDANGERETADG